MKMTYEQLESISLASVEAAFGIAEEDIAGIEEPFTPDLGVDESISVEIYFDEPTFMRKYYNGSILSMTFNVTENTAVIHAFIGAECSNPELANEFLDMYVENSRHSEIWGPPTMCESNFGLMMVTCFSFESEKELGEEFTKRLQLFTDERFTNELRPFIHYFED